jgi:hypothetical protein
MRQDPLRVVRDPFLCFKQADPSAEVRAYDTSTWNSINIQRSRVLVSRFGLCGCIQSSARRPPKTCSETVVLNFQVWDMLPPGQPLTGSLLLQWQQDV